MIDVNDTSIRIYGQLAQCIERGEAVSIGLLVYDVENDQLKIIGFIPEMDALLAKFGIRAGKLT